MFSQLCVNAVVAGSIYALVGVGFSLIYQVQRFFHFTHGLGCAVGAYAAYSLCRIGISSVVAVVLGVCAAGTLGALLEILMIAPVRKRNSSALVLLLASIGAYLVGQNLISLGFGDDLKTLRSGNISPGLQMLGARLTLNQVGIVLGSALAVLAVAVWLRVTQFGRNTRALANDEQLAAILGAPVNRLRMTVTMVGSGLAGLAGILFALDQDVVPTMGMRLMLYGVVAMIVGGRTSVVGGAAGGIIIGVAQNVCAIWLPLAWQDAVVFVIMVFFLMVRPYGIWGRPSRQVTV